MASPAQITANRRNAAKSTGPKTAPGKAVASRNALRHGLTAEQVVLFDEAAENFAAFHAELRATYAPADAIEEELVERIVVCAWRLRRAARAEAGLVERAMQDFDGWGIEDAGIGRAFGHASSNIARVIFYESIIDRALRRAQMQLERRQAQRHGEKIKIDKTNPISESAMATIDAESTSLAPHPNPLPASGEREGPASAGVRGLEHESRE